MRAVFLTAVCGYARAQKLSQDIQDDVTEYAIYSMRQMGVITKAITKAKPGREPGELSSHAKDNSAKGEVLNTVGVTWKQASEAEKLAEVPEDEFAEIVAKEKAGGTRSPHKIVE